MKTINRLLARSLPSLTLFAWSGVLLYFYFSGRLNHYLIETYRPFVLATGLLLPIVAIGLLFTGRGVVVNPDEETDAMAFGVRANTADPKLRPGQIIAFLVLLLPVGAAAAVKNDSFSARAIFNRGLVENSSGLPQAANSVTTAAPQKTSAPAPAAATVKSAPAPAASAAAPPASDNRPPAPEPPLPTKDGSAPPATANTANSERVDATQYLRKSADGTPIAEVVDFLFAADDPSMRPDFEGKKFEVVGQFLPDRGGEKMKFQLVRMFMLCCAADARPVAVTVQAPGTLEGIADMSWVKVIGNLKFAQGSDGRMTPVLHADKILPTDPPAEIMLY